jgi:ectoine hydroxylase-related dioxygenase (phytanoyl-CoA dioxygenase family)
MTGEPLTPLEIEHYRREGYVVVESLFGADDLARIYATIRALVERALGGEDPSQILELEPEALDGERVPRRIFSPYDQHAAFRDLAHDERLLDRIESLIGPNFNLQHSKLNMKPAKIGSIVEWHQDLAYFPHTNDDLVTTLIYLDDATEENGCLQVLPRHHHHYFDHAGPDGRFAGMIAEDLSDGRFGRPVPLAAPAGSVIFMHCITPHSSLPNRSSRGRRTLIYEYRAADSYPIYYSEMTAVAEAKYRPIRGQPAPHARFGGPPPLIPKVGKYTSLYELQAQAKSQVAEVARLPSKAPGIGTLASSATDSATEKG